MGTLLFLVLHATKQLNSPMDSYLLSLLVSLDAQLAFRVWVYQRSQR